MPFEARTRNIEDDERRLEERLYGILASFHVGLYLRSPPCFGRFIPVARKGSGRCCFGISLWEEGGKVMHL